MPRAPSYARPTASSQAKQTPESKIPVRKSKTISHSRRPSVVPRSSRANTRSSWEEEEEEEEEEEDEDDEREMKLHQQEFLTKKLQREKEKQERLRQKELQVKKARAEEEANRNLERKMLQGKCHHNSLDCDTDSDNETFVTASEGYRTAPEYRTFDSEDEIVRERKALRDSTALCDAWEPNIERLKKVRDENERLESERVGWEQEVAMRDRLAEIGELIEVDYLGRKL
ncbi:hypothetical protein N7532_009061 [Penicillium argentinense]|uniref:Uncharacterized protein n=1 Tax=Penicillium argentinense TaxID=1131581 RepID=A0A9W9K347_9EURO|nr:uncharacterized protein N7532_009061 [Penicillium argentinense]KAJ5090377.1 hypothetical protein N7532_009061 [Penicillium argentinense]